MHLTGWGRYPVVDAAPVAFPNPRALAQTLPETGPLIPFGNGRSYGDSALICRNAFSSEPSCRATQP